MALIRSRKKNNASHLAALVAAAMPLAAMAEEPVVLPNVSVEAKPDVPYKADESSNSKYTQPLIDTPQTIQVIKKEVLLEQGATTLMQALQNTPGITMQLGENGATSAGDVFSMRGVAVQTSLFVDGIRDLGPVTRDVYNLEQIEIVKGAAGTDIGRGASSGYINLITKLPSLDGANSATLMLGTANKKRATVDLNEAIGESTAIRLNAMVQDGDVDSVDTASNSGYAIAPSIGFGLGTPTRVYLYSQHVRQDNVPYGGIPTIGLEGYYNADPLLNDAPAVDRSNYYGSTEDYEKISADMVTAKFEHDLGDKTTVRNISRYGRSTMDRLLTGVNIGSAGISTNGSTDPADWTVSRRPQRVDQLNEILANQTSLTSEFEFGGFKHALVSGLEVMYERQKTLGSTTANELTSLYDPDPTTLVGTAPLNGASADGSTLSVAAYLFDTLTLNERWQLNGGLRFERYYTDYTSVSSTTATPPSTATIIEASDNLLSWKVGAVYKPAANGSIYASVGTSKTPPGSANFALSTSTTSTFQYNNNPATTPQETFNAELGTKWALLEERLNLTAAIFRTETDGVASIDPVTLEITQEGKVRVDGIELGAVGQLTNFWQLTAGVAFLRPEAIDQVSLSGGVPVQSDSVRFVPEVSATVWSSYTLGNFTLGGGVRYMGEQKRVVTVGQPTPNGLSVIPDYWVADMMLAYRVNKNVNLRLNVYNLFDELYIQTLNSGGGRVTLGQPRAAALTAEFLF